MNTDTVVPWCPEKDARSNALFMIMSSPFAKNIPTIGDAIMCASAVLQYIETGEQWAGVPSVDTAAEAALTVTQRPDVEASMETASITGLISEATAEPALPADPVIDASAS